MYEHIYIHIYITYSSSTCCRVIFFTNKVQIKATWVICSSHFFSASTQWCYILLAIPVWNVISSTICYIKVTLTRKIFFMAIRRETKIQRKRLTVCVFVSACLKEINIKRAWSIFSRMWEMKYRDMAPFMQILNV